MSRTRLVQDGYRGWYGRENQYNATLRQGMKSITDQSNKNDRIKFDYNKKIKKLQKDEKVCEVRLKRQLRKVKMELIQMKAYGEVYRQLSFMKFDQLLKEGRNEVLKEQVLKKEQVNSSSKEQVGKQEVSTEDNNKFEPPEDRVSFEDDKEVKPTDDLSLNKSTVSSTVLKPIHEDEEIKSSCADDFAEESPACKDDLLEEGIKDNILDISQLNIDNIDTTKQGESSESKLFLTEATYNEDDLIDESDDEDLNSLMHANKNLLTKSEPIFHMDNKQMHERRQSVAEINAWKLGLFRSYTLKNNYSLKEKSKSLQQEGLPVFKVRRSQVQQPQMKLWENSLSRSDRKSTVFPEQCRNTFTLRKVINEKAGQLIYEWTPENVRKVQARKILDSMHLPEIVSRRKTTSAIYRDYNQCKERYKTFDHCQGKKLK